jgi:hypothetical protein
MEAAEDYLLLRLEREVRLMEAMTMAEVLAVDTTLQEVAVGRPVR